jgi:hypothetical protein
MESASRQHPQSGTSPTIPMEWANMTDRANWQLAYARRLICMIAHDTCAVFGSAVEHSEVFTSWKRQAAARCLWVDPRGDSGQRSHALHPKALLREPTCSPSFPPIHPKGRDNQADKSLVVRLHDDQAVWRVSVGWGRFDLLPWPSLPHRPPTSPDDPEPKRRTRVMSW